MASPRKLSPLLTTKTEPCDPSGGVPALAPPPVDPASLPRRKRLWAWWLSKAVFIAAHQNRVLAWLSYRIGLGPVAWWLRRFGSAQLQRNSSPSGDSAWTPRDQPIATDPQRIRRPF